MMYRDRVVFFSKRDLAGEFELRKGEDILRAETKSDYTDINDILELYHIKQYIDNGIYLNTWTQDDINNFKQKVASYGKIIGKFMSTITSEKIKITYQSILPNYENSFWEIINDYGLFKNVTKEDLLSVLYEKPLLINKILQHKKIVEHFNTIIKDFLLSHPETATILLSIYEIEKDSTKEQYYLPPSLTVEDKETIILNYLDSPEVNINYLPVIQNARNREDFKLSDKTRLKAKRLNEKKTDEFFNTVSGTSFGVSISFPENAPKIKDRKLKDDRIIEYTYSLDFIKANNNPHALFENFHYLFKYLDNQHRIGLTNKKSSMDVLEMIGVHSKNEYIKGIEFSLSEMTSYVQILGYKHTLEKMGNSLEDTLSFVFSTLFAEKYGFANNARLTMPTGDSYLEKVRSLAPEFESLLKQYKLFVEEGCIDFELLEMSSSPYSVKDIPSLNPNKYIYINSNNFELSNIIRLFFSDQTLLGYVNPFKDKHYHTLFDLLANEDVAYNQYEEYQKSEIDYLVDQKYLYVDGNGNIQFVNLARVTILYDLFLNEAASFHRYDPEFRSEALNMERAGLVYFGNTLFSIPEQSYFNYHLNKSEFTNGLDLRNKYAHGTSADPNKTEEHEYAYLMYLKLIVLALLKIEDDLILYQNHEQNLLQRK
ncbi:MAG: hypothetical protein IJP79_09440 [Paludibacteraceae bacterium]|nr:hypothetical protein [Paludibacteraceae bacterium]